MKSKSWSEIQKRMRPILPLPGLLQDNMPCTWPTVGQHALYLAYCRTTCPVPGLLQDNMPFTWPTVGQHALYLAYCRTTCPVPGLLQDNMPCSWPTVGQHALYLAYCRTTCPVPGLLQDNMPLYLAYCRTTCTVPVPTVGHVRTWPTVGLHALYLAYCRTTCPVPGLLQDNMPCTQPTVGQHALYLAYCRTTCPVPGLLQDNMPCTLGQGLGQMTLNCSVCVYVFRYCQLPACNACSVSPQKLSIPSGTWQKLQTKNVSVITDSIVVIPYFLTGASAVISAVAAKRTNNA